MNAKQVFLISSVLLCIISVGAIGQDKYTPKENEELYGTWINTQYPGLGSMRPQKIVVTADGYKRYLLVSDSAPSSQEQEGTLQIISKWTDDEGNIWYRSFLTVTLRGATIAELDKLSNSATVWESVWAYAPTPDPDNFPKKIDPKDMTYNIRYRAGD